MRAIATFLLGGYHRVLSPLIPNACRFHPSCSVYATEAIGRYGTLKGIYLAARRVCRCQPWNPGGYDPVR